MATTRMRRTYDPRLRQLIRETGDVRLAIQGGVPRSTARDWSQSRSTNVVTLDVAHKSTLELEREIVVLRSGTQSSSPSCVFSGPLERS